MKTINSSGLYDYYCGEALVCKVQIYEIGRSYCMGLVVWPDYDPNSILTTLIPYKKGNSFFRFFPLHDHSDLVPAGCNPVSKPAATIKTCNHNYVNVGFTSIKMVCKYCGKDQNNA